MKSIDPSRAGLSSQQKRELLARHMDPGFAGLRLCPSSFAQQRLWFLEQLEPGTASNNICSGLRLIGDLDTQALRRAVARIVERHDTLRTSFVSVADELFQRVSLSVNIDIPLLDLRALPGDAREPEAYRLASEECNAPFDLQSSSLLRVKLIQTGDREHILVFTMHHLVSDGWSMGVFVEELVELYQAELERRPSRLPPPEIQYARYAEWQRETIHSPELARQIQYWRTRLAGIDSRLELPGDPVPPAEQSAISGVASIPAPPSLMEGIKTLAQGQGTTPFTVLLATLGVLLHRYSQQQDLCIGVPVAGRRLLETEALIGLFVNPLVVRIDLSGNPKFRDLLAGVHDALLEAHSNQDLPFERIVEELQPKRSLTHHPIFQVMMTALKAPLRERTFAGLTVCPYAVGASGSPLDLTVFVVEASDGSTWWRFQYNTTRFHSARIWRAIGHYQTLLNGILRNPDQRIGSLELLTPGELEQFSAWNDTAATYPPNCLHELIAEQAARSRDRIAAVFGEKRLTYNELDVNASRVAAVLRAAGAGPGVLVAIYMERSLEMLVGLLGILKSGAAYVPLDPDEPAARCSLKIEDSGAQIILTQASLASHLSPVSGTRISIEDAVKAPLECPAVAQDPESLAYVIYTSGSTGKPKGVCVSHRALVNLLTSMRREPGLQQGDRFLAVTNLCFDISALELFLPLLVGAQVVIASKETAVDGASLLDHLRRYSITAVQGTPATWRILLAGGWSRESGNQKVLCGGEALPPALGGELLNCSDCVWNVYGPAETTVWSSVSRVREEGGVAIGRPIQNTRFYVLDRRMMRVPVGIPGELYIGGSGLAHGYLNNPELTCERFVADPFFEGKLYRTGDEVRFRADGEIEYLGRLDFQVKLRGHRIELGEVEFIATQYPGVSQALALVREDAFGDPRLVCHVVPQRGSQLRAADLLAAMKSRLPDYMIPSIVILDSLPLTRNGKIDLANLPEPTLETTPTRPPTAIEQQLLEIWKQLLKRKGIGIADNFFDVGGHSLLAMKLLSEVASAFGGRSLPVAAIFRAPTVEQMAALLSLKPSKSSSSVVTLQPLGLQPPLFLIPGAYGNAVAYADFARSFGSDRPIHLLEPVGFEGRGRPLERIEEVAANFLQEIRKVQPRGPYRLIGFCIGGIVAFEMAQQLVAAGEETPWLAMVETWHPRSVPETPRRSAPRALRPFVFFARGLGRHVRAMLRLPPREALRYFREKSPIIREMIVRRDVYRGIEYKRYIDFVVEAAYRAGSRYDPASYAGDILLFIAGNLKVEAGWDTRLAWRELARDGCAVVRLAAGNAAEVLKKPYVKALADRLMEGLRNWPEAARIESAL
ncbi:MAG TPA: amino acid adenylation domain-containing protein [Bryobacteraceae bacterium]